MTPVAKLLAEASAQSHGSISVCVTVLPLVLLVLLHTQNEPEVCTCLLLKNTLVSNSDKCWSYLCGRNHKEWKLVKARTVLGE